MAIEVRPLQPDETGPVFDGTVRLMDVLVREADPDMDAPGESELRNRLRGNETFEKRTLVALDDAEVVGLARLFFHHIEGNTDLAEVRIEVDPERRRQGIGRALLVAVADVCVETGRPKLLGFGLNAEPTSAFWSAAGAELGLVERTSRVWVAEVDQERMASWIERRHDRAGDYTLEFWRGPTPGHLQDAMATLTTAMNDAPTDDLDVGDDVWTADDVVELDAYFTATGQERWTGIVFGPDGDPAGLTTVMRNTLAPRFSHQGDTVVLDHHRGRGLGRWLKADMLERLRADAPDVEAIDTENAGSNDAMLAINVAMGFRPVHEIGYWQTPVADLQRRLGR